jgi:hypothetical protein
MSYKIVKAIFNDYYIIINGTYISTNDYLCKQDIQYTVTGIDEQYIYLINPKTQTLIQQTAEEFAKHWNEILCIKNIYNENIRKNIQQNVFWNENK